MTRPVVFRPQAEAEVLAARQWYEERRAGLGEQFRAALDEAIDRVSRQPDSFPRVHGEMRRALVRRFPFGLYFEIIDTQIVVLGVVHGHRDPRTWQSRR
jgi:plasmid stabilization system protein ParE